MSEFDDQQKQWLQGFVSGIEARKAADKMASRAPAAPAAQPIRPDALQYAAQAGTRWWAAPRPGSSPRASTSS